MNQELLGQPSLHNLPSSLEDLMEILEELTAFRRMHILPSSCVGNCHGRRVLMLSLFE